jgi:hypothetical protein
LPSGSKEFLICIVLTKHHLGGIEVEAKLVRATALRMKIDARLVVLRGDYVPVGDQKILAIMTPNESSRIAKNGFIEKLDYGDGS